MPKRAGTRQLPIADSWPGSHFQKSNETARGAHSATVNRRPASALDRPRLDRTFQVL